MMRCAIKAITVLFLFFGPLSAMITRVLASPGGRPSTRGAEVCKTDDGREVGVDLEGSEHVEQVRAVFIRTLGVAVTKGEEVELSKCRVVDPKGHVEA
jgi:hypothetical protein